MKEIIEAAKAGNIEARKELIKNTCNQTCYTVSQMFADKETVNQVMINIYKRMYASIQNLNSADEFMGFYNFIIANEIYVYIKNLGADIFSSISIPNETLVMSYDDEISSYPAGFYTVEDNANNIARMNTGVTNEEKLLLALNYLGHMELRDMSQAFSHSIDSLLVCLNSGREKVIENIKQMTAVGYDLCGLKPLAFYSYSLYMTISQVWHISMDDYEKLIQSVLTGSNEDVVTDDDDDEKTVASVGADVFAEEATLVMGKSLPENIMGNAGNAGGNGIGQSVANAGNAGGNGIGQSVANAANAGGNGIGQSVANAGNAGGNGIGQSVANAGGVAKGGVAKGGVAKGGAAKGLGLLKGASLGAKIGMGVATVAVATASAVAVKVLVVDKNKDNKPDTGTQVESTTVAGADQTTEAADQITDEVTTEEIEEVIFGSIYKELIVGTECNINSYYWQQPYEFSGGYPFAKSKINSIAITDITGDNVPELIMAYNSGDNTVANLEIYTIENGAKKLLFSEGWDFAVAGGTDYILFQEKGSSELNFYKGIGDDGYDSNYGKFVMNSSGKLELQENLAYSEDPNEDYTDMIYECKKNGSVISKDQYEAEEKEILDNMETIIFFNYGGSTIFSDEIASVNGAYLTVEEAIALCDENAGISSTTGGSAAGENVLPFSEDISMYFSSGVGGWGTDLDISPDGSFKVSYHDSDMGDSGSGYDATVYAGEAYGKFVDVEKIDDYTYSMKIDGYTYTTPTGTEKIDNVYGHNVRYIYTDVYGIGDASGEYYLYLPGKPVSELPEEYVTWIYGLSEKTNMSGYGIYNVNDQAGFGQGEY